MPKRFSVQEILKQSALPGLLLSLFLVNPACGNKNIKQLKNGTSGNAPEKIETVGYPDDIKAKPFQNSDSTWGFTIYINGKIYIHQQVIPGTGSVTGFQSKKDAAKTAELVIKKIKNHVSPESVNGNELDSLGIVRTEIKTR
ncbi:MAG: hypothetical protein C0408_00145 [Odoribacter sp.]|nr:hypothetical protein [Odoribacter sp.]